MTKSALALDESILRMPQQQNTRSQMSPFPLVNSIGRLSLESYHAATRGSREDFAMDTESLSICGRLNFPRAYPDFRIVLPVDGVVFGSLLDESLFVIDEQHLFPAIDSNK
jgi:hypothetical protein